MKDLTDYERFVAEQRAAQERYLEEQARRDELIRLANWYVTYCAGQVSALFGALMGRAFQDARIAAASSESTKERT